jgi:AmmeMemoRadiSam system protein B/AmmeMemoRadiSam system protein A
MEIATGPVRRPAIAGTFYPAEEARLRADVRAMLEAAAPLSTGPAPKALVAPHAGYIYSGPVAARAYARLARLRGQVSRIVLLGPVHRVPVRGIALPGSTAFDTPLGHVPLDLAALEDLRELPWVTESAEAHAPEHSLEVHLPFLQEALGEFSLVPLAVGAASPEQVAQTLERLWGGPETRIVISSDLSHYLPYATAQRTDRGTVEDMLALDPRIDHHHACGATPVNGLLLLARRRGLVPELLDLRNSGDTAGDRSRVVGYASIAFHENTDGTAAVTPDSAAAPVDDGARGRVLLGLARAAIGRQLGLDMISRGDAAFLGEPGATFVTLRKAGALRGCMGSLQAHRPLGEDVRHNARSAAFLDPRFRPLSLREFDNVEVEVSLLSPPEPMAFVDEGDALAQLQPVLDGVILQCGEHRATFLPQVWDELPDPRVFMAHLKRKAGLAVDFWSPEVHLQRYRVQKWTEDDAQP